MNPEFNRGDLVTFNAYEGEEIPARVIGVVGSTGLCKYQLEGVTKALISVTTGRSIKESIHFQKPEEFVW